MKNIQPASSHLVTGNARMSANQLSSKPKVRLLIIFFAILLGMNLIPHATSSQPKIFRLYADQSIQNATWSDSVYLLPAFENGKVTFIDGFTPDYTLRLNYNMYFEYMYFITSAGDTVPLKKQKTLKMVTIKNRQFYYDYKNGFVEIIHQGTVSLAKKEVLTCLGQVYANNYGKELVVFETADVRGVTERYDRLYRHDRVYYLIDKKNRTFPAKRSSFLRMCKGNKQQIRDHFNNRQPKSPFSETELVALLQKCQ